MGRVGKLLKTAIEKFIVQTVETRLGLNQTAATYSSSGDDSPPLKDDRIILVTVDGTGRYAAVGVLSVTQGANPGEKIIYSRDAEGEVQAKISLLNDGIINMESPADIAVAAEGNITIETKKEATITADENITVGTKKDVAINADGNVTIDGTAVKINGGGNVELNGNTKQFVTFKELDTALKPFVVVLKTHTHLCAAPLSPSGVPVPPIELDISAAQTTTVLTGG